MPRSPRATRRRPARDTGGAATVGRTLYLFVALLVASQLYWILSSSNHASISTILKVPDEPVAKELKRINAIGDELGGNDSRPSTIEKHPPPIPRDQGHNSSQTEGAEESENAFQIPKNVTLSKEDLKLWKKHHLRHAYDNQKPSTNVIANNKNDQEKRTVIFVHFHKAGGTSMIQLFKSEGYQLWNRQKNGNPFGIAEKPPKNAGEEPLIEDPLNDDPNGDVHECQKYQFRKLGNATTLKFWRYSRSQFEAFLRDGQGQIFWPYCLGGNTKDSEQVAADKGAEFVSMEWNFFTQDHFFEKDYLRQQAKIDIITVLRDPYDRFISNFYFKWDNPKKNFDDPMEWSHLDIVRKKLTMTIKPKNHKTHLPRYQYGALVPHDNYFSVNYNKPNYYTAFLNGLAENTDDPGWGPLPFDFEYFAFGLNQTHLEIAKQRLETMFDAVLILERPETHVQLDRWFAFSGDTNNRTYLPHHRKGRASKETRHALNFTREEFYRYNALDKELYEYAVELALSKSVSKNV